MISAKQLDMSKQAKDVLQAATLAAAIGVSIISYDNKSLWLSLLAGALIAVYVHISNIKTKI